MSLCGVVSYNCWLEMASHWAGSPEQTQDTPPSEKPASLLPALAREKRLSMRPMNWRPTMLTPSREISVWH